MLLPQLAACSLPLWMACMVPAAGLGALHLAVLRHLETALARSLSIFSLGMIRRVVVPTMPRPWRVAGRWGSPVTGDPRGRSRERDRHPGRVAIALGLEAREGSGPPPASQGRTSGLARNPGTEPTPPPGKASGERSSGGPEPPSGWPLLRRARSMVIRGPVHASASSRCLRDVAQRSRPRRSMTR